jgi:hypothetical protein
MKYLDAERYALAIFLVFAACFSGIAFFGDTKVKDLHSALSVGYAAVPMVVFAAGIFVSYAWKLRIFQGWFVPFPNLNGTWKGELQSNWIDPTTGKGIAPIPAILSIKQTFTRISCVMRTGESKSHSFAAGFWLDEDEQIRRLVYSYENKPQATVTHRSKPHGGTMMFEIIGDPVTGLRGDYFTDRPTSGTVTLTFHSKKRLDKLPKMGPHPMAGK